MKKLIFVLALLISPCLAWAGGVTLVGGKIQGTQIGSSGGIPADLVFFWTCEAATLGANDHSHGDATATAAAGATISATAVKIGSNGILISTTQGSYYEFDVSSNDIVPASGRIGFWLYIATWASNERIVAVNWGDPDNLFYLLLSGNDGTGAFSLYWEDGGTPRTTLNTTGVNIASAVWYFIEIAYDTNYTEIFIDGTSRGSVTTRNTISPVGIRWGKFSEGTLGSIYIDNCMISNSKTRDLNAWKNNTSTPTE